jgi:hypothetical protein
MNYGLSTSLFAQERLNAHILDKILAPGLRDFEIKFDAAFTSIEHLNLFAKERGAQILLENIPSNLSASERIQFRVELGAK